MKSFLFFLKSWTGRRSQKGFSLIEIIIVIAIISILVGIIVMRIGSSRAASKEKMTTVKQSIIYGQLQLYQSDHNEKLPEKLSDLVTSGYLKDDELKDGWGNYFCYLDPTSSRGNVGLSSKGPPQKLGNERNTICYVNGEKYDEKANGGERFRAFQCQDNCDGILK